MSRLRIGQEAPDLVVALPSLLNRSVEALNFVAYSAVPGIEKRLPDEKQTELERIVAVAAQLLKIAKEDIDYWKSSIVAGTWMTLDLDRFIQDALRHFPPSRSTRQLEISVISLTKQRVLQELAITRSQNKVLALCSRCKLTDGSTTHLPMMDFRCKPSPPNLKRLRIALRKLQQSRGVILNSGNSFHYCGFDLLNHDKWIEFFAGSLLLAPFTDSRYIAHRLAEGVANLRVTSFGQKKIPRIMGFM